ncbi:hypothetical protein F0L68_13795 [Solihabitans fulvus]|uniref:Uncharacterized protein n=1 Tax=Solihabitans fulvus TaxID=1892852 RepID=A0A5B2XEU6_9PSEU|nr:hypothetical protein [Solihabitans fulvus]KAA2262338.1 hypothetical protein F0L68_13795 [Solihabitans fulvus]
MPERSDSLPPSVYWRRRAMAFGLSLLALVGLAWLIGALVGALIGKVESYSPQGVANQLSVAASASPTSTPSPSPSPSSSVPPPANAAAGQSPSSPPPPPGPPQPCPDAVLKVTAEADHPEYQVGQRPGFKIVIGNTGPVACTREIGRHLRELVVSSADGATRLWSSSDCYNTDGDELRILHPGEQFAYGLDWSGLTSAPGCRDKHNRVPAGDYLLTAKLGQLAGTPIAFRFN